MRTNTSYIRGSQNALFKDSLYKAFEKEALVHYSYFKEIAARLTRNYPDAEDLVQDTYMRAYRFFHTFEPGSNSKAWLYRIMKNLFINYSRKKTSHPSSSLEMAYYEPSIEADDRSISRYDISRLMENIKDEYRMVITMFHLEELSLVEISKALKWPLGTVKSRLHRARKEFKKILDESTV